MNTQLPYRSADVPLSSGEGSGVSGLTTAQIRQHYAEGKTRMIRKLFAIGYQMGYGNPTTAAEARMSKSTVAKIHINRWLLSDKSCVQKQMDEMTHKELRQVITQFEQVYKDFLKRL